jgi:hypothetical protein
VNRALRSERTLLATGSNATPQGDLSKGCRIGCGMACRTPHAKEHGIRDVTPELMERVKANIRDA